jgi:hypothetical protein
MIIGSGQTKILVIVERSVKTGKLPAESFGPLAASPAGVCSGNATPSVLALPSSRAEDGCRELGDAVPLYLRRPLRVDGLWEAQYP